MARTKSGGFNKFLNFIFYRINMFFYNNILILLYFFYILTNTTFIYFSYSIYI